MKHILFGNFGDSSSALGQSLLYITGISRSITDMVSRDNRIRLFLDFLIKSTRRKKNFKWLNLIGS